MYAICFAAIFVSILIVLCCALGRASIYDKVLAVNILGTVMVLFIAVHGFFRGRPEFLDIALVYAMINFISTLAVLKFFENRNMAHGKESHRDASHKKQM